MASAEFFDYVRGPLFGGRLTQKNVDGLNKLVAYALDNRYDLSTAAYALATAHHETGRRMQPIREGFATTDAGARRAVASIHAKGIISRNYALPSGPYRKSYYGRGLVQITHDYNYESKGELLGVGDQFLRDPDLVLKWEYALPLLFRGIAEGWYRNKSIADYKVPNDFRGARGIINADVRKNGEQIAEYARHYLIALVNEYGPIYPRD